MTKIRPLPSAPVRDITEAAKKTAPPWHTFNIIQHINEPHDLSEIDQKLKKEKVMVKHDCHECYHKIYESIPKIHAGVLDSAQKKRLKKYRDRE